MGADRVCDAAAVLKFYGGPACVVDFGTATTFNAITKDGEYLGGAIVPGNRVGLLGIGSGINCMMLALEW